MSTFETILEGMKKHHATLFPPVERKDVLQASIPLVRMGLPTPPADYVRFLGLTNGVSWNGVEIFSLTNIDRADGAFHHPGLVSYQHPANNMYLNKKLLLGMSPEEFIIYNSENKTYQLVDRFTHEVMGETIGFEDILNMYLDEFEMST